jgi:hypothetical protein
LRLRRGLHCGAVEHRCSRLHRLQRGAARLRGVLCFIVPRQHSFFSLVV